MGRPNINIAFQKAATTGIQQGTTGIICVPFVNQLFTTSQATIKHRITLYSDIDNLPETYTYKEGVSIKKLLKQIWLGGVKEIVLLVFDKVKSKSSIMTEMQNYNFDFLYADCLLVDTPTAVTDIIAGTKDLNDVLNKMIFTIGQGIPGDHESILNIDSKVKKILEITKLHSIIDINFDVYEISTIVGISKTKTMFKKIEKAIMSGSLINDHDEIERFIINNRYE